MPTANRRKNKGNTAQFPPCGLSTAPAAAAPRSPYRHLELCGIAYYLRIGERQSK
ncbi:MAG: hypothetical protein WAQ76_04995 [Gemmiger qucibialis]